jgi:hypothetical protein
MEAVEEAMPGAWQTTHLFSKIERKSAIFLKGPTTGQIRWAREWYHWIVL